MEYHTTKEKEDDFIKHCVLRIRDVLKISKADAENIKKLLEEAGATVELK